MNKHLYAHIPFCTSICAYCDFNRTIYDPVQADAYLKQMDLDLSQIHASEMDTIYLGGGTPTALNLGQLDQLFFSLSRFQNVKEYTIESNIENLDEAKAKLAASYGVNRISLGVQSLQDDLLAYMHRKHHAPAVFALLELLPAWGIDNISCDLIYGLQNQTLETWRADLNCLAQNMNVKHLSLYALTIEENSIFGKQGVQPIDEDKEADMYEYAVQILESHGFVHYEVANFCRPGYASLHNLGYWHYDDFYGVGIGASGKENHRRYENVATLREYLEGKRSRNTISLNKEDEMFEHIMMSLRLKEGLSIAYFNDLYGINLLNRYKQAICKNMQAGLIVLENGFMKTTDKGMELLHDVLIEFMGD